MADIVNLNSPGEDALKGSVFFGSSLTPLGSFSNVPNYYTYNPTENSKIQIELTLKKIKDSLKVQLQNEYDYSEQDLNDDENKTIESFLFEFTSLLIDYSDLRNFVFFGSAHTEVAYNIKHIIETYPYKTLISDLTTSFDEIIITNDNSSNKTTIIFSETAIKDIGNFKFYDSDNSFNWVNYDAVDKNNKRYKILNAITPYSSSSIPFINNIQNGISSVQITTVAPHGFLNGQSIEIFEVEGSLLSGESTINTNGKFRVINATPTTFEIVDNATNNSFLMNFTYTSGGKARLLPLNLNQRPYGFKITLEGILTFDQLISYTDINSNGQTGFIISPKQKVLNDFELNLTPIQKQLLAPIPFNITPWPRRIITENIQNIIGSENPSDDDIEFIQWLSNPDLLYRKDGGELDDDIAFADVYGEYNIVRAQSLDETTTNQLIRRALPYNAISELNDPDDGYFQRFILIAGWFYDQIYLYIKFIKYVHTLNYGDFNQLSPEYYKYYADNHGFDLFSDDSIDFSKLVIQTEPGLIYTLNSNLDTNDKYYRLTIQKLQYERQKRLLLSLFYLYRIKGTQQCIKQLVSLLGAPEGLLLLQEFAYKFDSVDQNGYVSNGNLSKTLIVDNEKVHVPEYHFEIDPDYLIDKVNINNSINQPYVYRMKLHNEATINLRQLGIATDPAQAIDNQIKSIFGNIRHNYVKFNNGEFANLQNLNESHFLLPVSLPDKYFGISVNYMIARDGYIKGIANNLEETAIHLGSLILTSGTSFKSSSFINNISLLTGNTVALIETQGNHSFLIGDKIKITNVNGIANINSNFIVSSVPSNTSIEIIGVFSGSYISGGAIDILTPNKLNAGFNTTYCLPEVFSNYNEDTILNPSGTNPLTDFDLLKKHYTSSNFLDEKNFQYIFIRLEGKDLVVRLKLISEINSTVVERVSIFENIFDNDGLNHTLRLLFRPEGIEVYQDYKFLGISEWRLPDTSNSGIPYLAFEIPKKDIYSCTVQPIPITDLISISTNTGLDKIKWWDLFIGLPQNIDFYFNKVQYFENIAIDDYNIGDRIVDNNNSNADTYLFDFTQTTLTSPNTVTIDCQFLKANPVNNAIDYSGSLPTKQNQNNIVVVDNLTLTSKSFNPNGDLEKYYPNTKQDYFLDDNIFERYGWEKDIHKVYEYKNFGGKVLNLNSLYSPQVLTYDSLLEFLDLIENKFKNTIKQFIPIVINISEFGRMIKSSMFKQNKIRYPGIHKFCKGEKVTSNSSIQSRIFDEDTTSASITWEGIDPYCEQVTSSSTTTSSTTTLTTTFNLTTSSTTTTSTTSTTTTSTSTTTTTTTTEVPLLAEFHAELSNGRAPFNVGVYTLTLSRISTTNTSVTVRIRGTNTSSGLTFNHGFSPNTSEVTVVMVPAGQLTATVEGIYFTPGGSFGIISEVQLFNATNISNSNITKRSGDSYTFSVV